MEQIKKTDLKGSIYYFVMTQKLVENKIIDNELNYNIGYLTLIMLQKIILLKILHCYYVIYRIQKRMQFKLNCIYLFLYFLMLQFSQQTCWLTTQNKQILESQIIPTTKYQFSLHHTSGVLYAKQERQSTRETVFFGDFGVLRAYNQQYVTIFEGLYMKLMPLSHWISSWPPNQYQSQNVLELQIVFNYAFGSRQTIPYEQIGMSYFIVAANIRNKTVREIGRNFTKQMMSLQKGKKLSMESYFYRPPQNIANNLYIYRADPQILQKILPISSIGDKKCTPMPWIVHRRTLQIDISDFEELMTKYNINPSINKQKDSKKLKVFAAKLRNNNQIEQNRGQNEGIIKQEQKQKQSDSCQQL